MKFDLNTIAAATAQWNALLPGIIQTGEIGLAAIAKIKAALEAKGFQADTDALNAVIVEANVAKAEEDALIDPPVSPV